MSRISQLSLLQQVDLEFEEKTKRAHLVEQQLEQDPTVVAARTALAAIEKEFADLSSRLKTIETQARDLATQISGVEERLYSGKVHNPKELEGMEKDLQMHKRHRNELDDQILNLMEQSDRVQERLNADRKTLELVEGNRASNVSQLSSERETLAKRLEELAVNRERTRASLDADTLRAYDQLRRRTGRAVSQVRRDSCGVCGVSIPTGLVQRIRSGDELVYCSGCNRILAA